MKLGILFSGQGSQKPGMGLDLLTDSLFKQTIQEASEATELDIIQILKSEHGELDETKNVQPALVAVSCGIYKMLQRDLPKLPVAGMVGLSLGEYAALISAGALSLEPGLSLLADRGRYMQVDADAVASSLAALINPDLDIVNQVLAEHPKVAIANYNSPRQLVIGGPEKEVQLVAELLKQHEAAKRVVVLNVSGAFHTPLFNPARQKMHQRLKSVVFNEPEVQVMSNTTIQPFTADNIAEILERQLAQPTHFGEDLQELVEHEQIDGVLEIGPGKTLSRFARQVNRNLSSEHIASLEDYQAFIKEHQEWI
ncbi:ACP S-malonyltransferase [Limosilactobacillus fastidiosus]|uniref:Malonyl CoA-acyl carrier protein transacylase n=1 Tax=Limosilactobacillus fastidiosus TaxID=2759855 RepID=A0A7W3TYT5_9LACO|nr:ACP S-malonyltransferase [Limosilactobacillus fastidiosus]MBB1062514.1 ACP S-malonyltransferase [Limosilactobacillus fastidiosus]MBB1085535.1 ACP S-malonyltransferase [Limosilactobacillus fastidiosus]MCD7083588.1 ACP S-malonyltransferase [Limosilactobacillus fastidiosus]MCD7085988.1 ACP S-malonyltransferase [Limosilactobacillus fastidiosus]MCD7114368.1 ACP S-malonyltransferase [Limosilactobacillus fastidiosus]